MTGIKSRQARLTKIGNAIKTGVELSNEDREFIAAALINIGKGEDPKIALDVKALRGEHTSIRKQHADLLASRRKKLAQEWIAIARLPEPDGLGLSLEEAAGLIGESGLNAFDLTEETLKTYYDDKPGTGGSFTLPD
jgi:hypothetical protein